MWQLVVYVIDHLFSQFLHLCKQSILSYLNSPLVFISITDFTTNVKVCAQNKYRKRFIFVASLKIYFFQRYLIRDNFFLKAIQNKTDDVLKYTLKIILQTTALFSACKFCAMKL